MLINYFFPAFNQIPNTLTLAEPLNTEIPRFAWTLL